MTPRHRYLGTKGVCEERFGGVAMCAQPLTSHLHYTDTDHPYSPSGEDGGCHWPLAQASDGVCDEPSRARVHWSSGLVRPPDEDAVARAVAVVTGRTAAPVVSPWARVVAALGGDGTEVVGGPWPVRLVWLPDEDVLEMERFWEALNAVLALGEEFTLSSERAEGGRWLLLTWGVFAGLGREILADEVAARYDTSG